MHVKHDCACLRNDLEHFLDILIAEDLCTFKDAADTLADYEGGSSYAVVSQNWGEPNIDPKIL